MLSPELQECMDLNEGSAATSAHGPKSPETPCKGEELSTGGELAHQSGVNTKAARGITETPKVPSFRLTRESMEADVGTS